MPKNNTQSIKLTVCTEGMTLNGFSVTREQIQQMADNYSPQLYAARINLEHIKSLFPDSVFRNYGLVQKASARELTEGPLKGKLALDVEFDLDSVKDAGLIALNQSGQKLFSSIEFYDRFPAVTGAYLSGIAVTDTPAAVGTQLIQLSARERGLPDDEAHRFCSASLETAFEVLEQENRQQRNDDQQDGARFLSKIRDLLSGNRRHDRSELAQLHEAIELTANTCRDAVDQVKALSSLEAQVSQQQLTITRLSGELDTLRQQLSAQDANASQRPLADGSAEALAQY